MKNKHEYQMSLSRGALFLFLITNISEKTYLIEENISLDEMKSQGLKYCATNDKLLLLYANNILEFIKVKNTINI